MNFRNITFSLLIILTLPACGGGGGGSSKDSSPPVTDSWTENVFTSASNFADQCAVPRTGVDPSTNLAYRDDIGTTTDENNWLRSFSNDTYLWYNEIIDRDPSLYSTADYFDLLVTEAVTLSGNPKDKFHFTYATDEWISLSESGIQAGYGAQWIVIADTPPRNLVVAYTDANSPATAANVNLRRGDKILEVDGVDLIYANTDAEINTINAGLFPGDAGETHRFLVQNAGTSITRTITMISANVAAETVQNVHSIPTATGNVGYLAFHSHISLAESALIDAVENLQADGISDLIIDIRYNTGGFLAIASELSYMIAGMTATANKTFEELQFNDKYPNTSPITGQSLEPIPFFSTSQGFSVNAGQGLPSLNLPRVFVLTGENTCSASESIINALRGIDVEVIQIGSTTCGKPFGFYPEDNCGTTYFTIQFETLNDKEFGGYTDGFSPANNVSPGEVSVPGCAVADDLSKPLGDLSEARLAAALSYRETGTCPSVSSGYVSLSRNSFSQPLKINDGIITRTPWLQNRVIDRRLR
jgi:C-terminal processing protease CtpA/Prc